MASPKLFAHYLLPLLSASLAVSCPSFAATRSKTPNPLNPAAGTKICSTPSKAPTPARIRA
jgi:hypothetical protein